MESTKAFCEGVEGHDSDHEKDFAEILPCKIAELEVFVLFDPRLGPDHEPVSAEAAQVCEIEREETPIASPDCAKLAAGRSWECQM